MSTDVYFDFHSPESWKLYRDASLADNTNGRALPLFGKWWAFLAENRILFPDKIYHEPCRVAYLSNLVAHCNYELWCVFEQRWNTVIVSDRNIPEIVADWKVLFDNSQRPENAEDCGMPLDISPPQHF